MTQAGNEPQTPISPGPAAERLRFLILAAQREGDRLLTNALLPLNLTPSQAEVLRTLGPRAPLSVKQLGTLLICESGSPSRLVNTMIVKGLIETHPVEGDKRKLHLTLTEAGIKAEQAVVEIETSLYHFIDSRLPEDAMTAATAALSTLIEGLPSSRAIKARFPFHGASIDGSDLIKER